MAQKADAFCLVCTARGSMKRPTPNRISRVTIQARSVMLCREHAGLVAINMPRTWDELRALFGGTVDRRSPIPRSNEYGDRRGVPPRLEGRRKSYGRRRLDLDS